MRPWLAWGVAGAPICPAPCHNRTPTLDAVTLLQAQVHEVHRALEDSLAVWLRAVVPVDPALTAAGSRPVALFVHAATVEDIAIQSLLRGVDPLFTTSWHGRGPARYSLADLNPVRSYAHEVFSATNAYLAALTPAEVSRTVDLARMDLGTPTVGWVVSRFVVLELSQISGELLSIVQRPGARA